MNSVEFPNMEVIEQSAAEWVTKIDRGLTAEEQRALSEWLEVSPVHGEALVKCASMWDLLDVLSPIAKLMPIDKLNLHAEHAAFEESPDLDSTMVDGETKASNIRRFSNSRSGPWAIAATILMAVGIYFVQPIQPATQSLSTPVNMAEKTRESSQLKRYKTGVGEMSTVTLADGSVLQLNTDSELSIQFTENRRQLELLSGEVYFEVAKDPSKPFVVDVGSDQVVAVGTAFNIDARPGLDTEVLVTEGKVQVNVNANLKKNGFTAGRGKADELFLIPGQKVTIGENSPKVSDQQDSDTLLSWREGMLIFQGEPLSEAIREIDRYTALSFTIMDESIAQIPVGGFFKTGDTDQLLQILSLNFGVESKRIGDEVLLYKVQ